MYGKVSSAHNFLLCYSLANGKGMTYMRSTVKLELDLSSNEVILL